MADSRSTIRYGEPTEFVIVRIHNEVIVPVGCEAEARQWIAADMLHAIRSKEADAYLESEMCKGRCQWSEVELEACGHRVVEAPRKHKAPLQVEPLFNPFLRQWLNEQGYTEGDWPYNVPDSIVAGADAEFGRGVMLGEDGYPIKNELLNTPFDPILYGA